MIKYSSIFGIKFSTTKLLTIGRADMKKLYIALITVLVASAGVNLHAQDPQFTQFYANPLYLNPAFAGSKRCPRIAINARLQWTGISGNYRTYAASYDQHIDAISGGIGIRFMRDEAGQ